MSDNTQSEMIQTLSSKFEAIIKNAKPDIDPEIVQKLLSKLENELKNPPLLPEAEVKVIHAADGNMEVHVTIERDGIQKGPFTVRQLIEALQQCKNQDAPVHAYLLEAGIRLPVVRVDDAFEHNRMVDLNINDDVLFEKEKDKDV